MTAQRRTTLGPNIGSESARPSMAQILGAVTPPELAVPQTPDPLPTEPPATERAAAPEEGAQPKVRLTTDIDAPSLDLARRAAYWSRRTMKDIVEAAITTEARRIAKELNYDELPPLPKRLRRGRL